MQDETVLYTKFMANIDNLKFVKVVQAEPETEQMDIDTNQKTVKYAGKACTKADIEDLITKHDKREPIYPDPDDCCGHSC